MLPWIIFIAFVILFLALDLGVFNRKAHVIKTKEAATWTAIWVTLGLAFSGIIYWLFTQDILENPTGLTPRDATFKYITGYLIELSLSIDNVFVIAVIFSSFAIPEKYQHKVLFWGILGAIVFRALMIFFGVALIESVDWIIYFFGAFLLYTAYKMWRHDDTNFDPKDGFLMRLLSKVMPVTHQMNGQDFFIKENGRRAATPLFIALIIIEFTDVLFALDSIPAILAITADPFIVFSSNIFAILGLRSMYFLISRMLRKFRFINYSLVVILAFVGIKMLLLEVYHFPEWVSLGIIVLALGGGILASVLLPVADEGDAVI